MATGFAPDYTIHWYKCVCGESLLYEDYIKHKDKCLLMKVAKIAHETPPNRT